MGIEPTPLCGPKIGCILKGRISSTALPIYQGGAAHAQAVGLLFALAETDLEDAVRWEVELLHELLARP
jgi:hypothetical protein